MLTMLEKARLFIQSVSADSLGRMAFAILGFALIFAVSASGQSLEYTVSPGDNLHVSVWGQEGLSGAVTVGPDGTIMLPPPVGSVYVNQMTAEEIAELLTKELEEFVKQPVVSVSIRSFQGFTVHILGQVKLPSFYRVPEGTSIQELVTKAGGFTDLADLTAIILVRRVDAKTKEIEKRTIDLSRFLEQNDMESNPVLENNDVVVVPKIGIDERAKQLVTVMGRVHKPGSYELDITMPLLDIIALAGGVSDDADLRDILILSRSEEEAGAVRRRVNLEDILSGNNPSQSQMSKVSPGDLIFVPSIRLNMNRMFYVNVVGQVIKPGAYQIAEDTRMIDAIFAAGGPAEGASIDNIAVIRSKQDSGQGSPAISLISLRDYLLHGSLEANPVLHEGDTVVVPIIESAKVIPPVQMAFSPSIAVNVIGEVAKPGAYQISTESTLLDVLVLAGGPTTNANLKETMVIRGSKSEGKEQFEIDLEKVMTEGRLDLLPDILSGDTVFLPKVKEKREWWRSTMTLVRDISTLVVLYLYLRQLS